MYFCSLVLILWFAIQQSSRLSVDALLGAALQAFSDLPLASSQEEHARIAELLEAARRNATTKIKGTGLRSLKLGTLYCFRLVFFRSLCDCD